MEIFGIHPLTFLPVLLGLFSLFAAAYILWINSWDPANQAFAFLSFGLGIWLLSTAFMWEARTVSEAVVLANIRSLGEIFGPSVTLHFALAFSRHPLYEKHPSAVPAFLYLPGFLFLPKVLSNEFVGEVVPTGYGYVALYTPTVRPFLLWHVLASFTALAVIGGAYFRVPRGSVVKKQIGVVWMGMLIPYGIGLFSFVFSNLTGIATPPIATFSAATFSIPLYIYAVNRFGLFRLSSLVLTHVFHNLQEGVLIHDLRLRITDGNPAFWSIAGAPAPPQPGTALRAFLQAYLPEALSLVDDLEKAPTLPLRKHVLLPRKDRHLEIAVYPLQEKGVLSRSLGYAWIVQDVTERMRTLNELQDTLRWILGLMEFSASLLSTLEHRKAVERALEIALQTCGGEMGGVFLYQEGRGVLRLEVHRRFPEAYLERFREARLGERVVGKVAQSREVLIIEDARKDPRATPEVVELLRYRSLMAVPLVSQGQLIGVLSLVSTRPHRFKSQRLPFFRIMGNLLGIAIHNAHLYTRLQNTLRELKATQERLVEAEKEAAVGRLVAGLAHEVNNPLTPVLGFSQLLLDRSDLPEEVREMIRLIEQNALRIRSITHGLLAFVRRYPSRKRPVDVNEVIRHVLELYKERFEEEGIEIRSDLSSPLPEIHGDFEALNQVVTNLLLNAEEAVLRNEGQRPRIIWVRTEAASDGRRVALSIEDSGPGIAPEVRSRIFEPFFTTKEVGKGTGLGLAIVKGIVEEHEGQIEVGKSELGGALFRIAFPALPSKHEPYNRVQSRTE